MCFCVCVGRKDGLKFMLERFLQFKKFENYSCKRDSFKEVVLCLDSFLCIKNHLKLRIPWGFVLRLSAHTLYNHPSMSV